MAEQEVVELHAQAAADTLRAMVAPEALLGAARLRRGGAAGRLPGRGSQQTRSNK